jgi:hypothetical protein
MTSYMDRHKILRYNLKDICTLAEYDLKSTLSYGFFQVWTTGRNGEEDEIDPED